LGETRKDNTPYIKREVISIYGVENLLAALNSRFLICDTILIFKSASLSILAAILTIDIANLIQNIQ
jgi:hypothetical protein